MPERVTFSDGRGHFISGPREAVEMTTPDGEWVEVGHPPEVMEGDKVTLASTEWGTIVVRRRKRVSVLCRVYFADGDPDVAVYWEGEEADIEDLATQAGVVKVEPYRGKTKLIKANPSVRTMIHTTEAGGVVTSYHLGRSQRVKDRESNHGYARRKGAKGFRRVLVWVHEEEIEAFKRYVAGLRK